MRFSWNCILKLLMSSLVTLNINLVLTLQFIFSGVPYVSHLVKFALSRGALPYIQERPFEYPRGCLSLMMLVAKEMVGAPLIPSMYGIHTEFQGFPSPFLERLTD